MRAFARFGIVLLLSTAGCASRAPAQTDTAMVTNQGELPPPGLGTLGQDDLAINLRQEELEIRVIPLDERLLRLLALDSYRSLHELVRTRALALDSVSRQYGVSSPGLLLVTFFGRRPGARFDPQLVTLVVRNQLYRPIGIVPFNAAFNSQQLETRQQATGIVLFEELLPVFEPFRVSYGTTSSDAWEGRLTRIQRERVRVMGRVRADSTRSP